MILPALRCPTLDAKVKALHVIYDLGMTWNGRSRTDALKDIVANLHQTWHDFYQARMMSEAVCLGNKQDLEKHPYNGVYPEVTLCNSARHLVAYIRQHPTA